MDNVLEQSSMVGASIAPGLQSLQAFAVLKLGNVVLAELKTSRCSMPAGISSISPLCKGYFLPSGHSIVILPLSTCSNSCFISQWMLLLQYVPLNSTIIFSILLLHSNTIFSPSVIRQFYTITANMFCQVCRRCRRQLI